MEIKIMLITQPRATPVEVTVEEGTTLESLARNYQDQLPYTVLAAKLDNRIVELTRTIESPCSTVEFLDMRDQAANLIYQRSISFVYLKAVRDVLGKVPVVIENSLNKGLYTEIGTPEPVTEEQVRQVEQRMRELVEKDIPF